MNLSKARASKILGRFPSCRILVVGDLMLDRFVYGDVTRISPEAPVPVVRVTRETAMPGGASNVASNIRALGAVASVAGMLGKDAAGDELRWLLSEAGVDTPAVTKSAERSTIVKTRIIASRQQVVRVDYEHAFPSGGRDTKKFLALLALELDRADGVILEDYGKGTLSQEATDLVLSAAARRGIPVGLDPKDGHDLAFDGITVATPNRKEAFAIAGVPDAGAAADPLKDKPLLKVGETLLEKWKAAHVAITLGAQGMFLLSKGLAPRHLPTRAQEVYDVSGAGDTVIAACVSALAAGADFFSAAALANEAAGVVVGKLGTASCSPGELIAHLSAGKERA